MNSEEETARLAGEFSELLQGGEIVALNGDLGAGKTSFIKHLLRNFEIDNVSSPTFAIVNEYQGSLKVNHFDFYRINKVEELYDIGFEEYLTREDTLTFIEWADLLPEVLPSKRIEISFVVNDDFSREISFKNIS
ncbi:MAG: tRNA (adenosine(37)-N6)-threonylcarbamoyltransferase complex ATPase subunit type 1 TsaE [Ignavibacteria bacterium]|nr:tRNA (adenosine(37)-N6)-threonylcarbamoyltransferase complex ATPase subunit type 1 TsaE [Ignavibacteria bacterium]MCU7503132.1 tRNA (adenosine(37)-N6)-threonylcarbamoyltransferase complex ATPase subunit type 1 TsaE [Ignavibacteria bacterium]MCU7518234.1 tRNA (adenosine(37)-N6)-threonylcarbamoyltransferase complex ATPase subunit type 1 TsaE [Ignavibacteria bacterium]